MKGITYMRVKVTDYIVKRLKLLGVQTVFGYQGGNISYLIDSIDKESGIEFVENYHEQASSFASNAYAQVNDSLGVALASSGPGAINLINGIANAFCDSIPCLFFTGDVNTNAKLQSGSRRQNSFQEIDFIPMIKNITKYAVSIDNPERIVLELEKSIKIALSDRKGPVVINLPHDVQRANIDIPNIPILKNYGSCIKNNVNCQNQELFDKAVDVINSSNKPVLLIGSGLRHKETKRLLESYLQITRIPVVSSLLALDLIPHNTQNFMGMVGSYGNRAANLSLKYADCLIVLGNRIDDRQIGPLDIDLFKDKNIIHVDIDPYELNIKLKEDISICGDAISALKYFIKHANGFSINEKWLNWLYLIKKKYPSYRLDNSDVNPNDFLYHLSSNLVNQKIVFSLDVGNNQMYSGQSIIAGRNTRILSSGGLGSMGYSLPAAIGAAYAEKKAKVISINGDGGIQMNLQELNTIDYHKLNISVIVLNNQSLGMIYDLQTKLFDHRFIGTLNGYNAPNFELIAKAYGFDYYKVKSPRDYAKAIDGIVNKKRVFVELVFKVETKTLPEPGLNLFDQLPRINTDIEEEINGKN